MMRRTCFWVLAMTVSLPWLGCGGSPSQQPRAIPVVQQTGLDEARQLLQGYVDGNPVGSEADSYESVVSAVRAEDSGKADILDAGLKQIAANPSIAARKAKELLDEL
jgi:hypothetical protein